MISFPNAKINLGLNIVHKRDDGFHNIETIFYPIQLTDMLEFVVNEQTSFQNSGITIDSSQEDNLVLKAYRLLEKDFSLHPLKIHLYKKIPFGAGLGGGSADATFMLKMINDDFHLALSDKQLENYARQLGSDCAFFVKNKPVFAFGKGDEFEQIELDLSGYHFLLVKPNVIVPTKDAYAGIKAQMPELGIKDIVSQPIETWKHTLVNDFEKTVFAKHPSIAEIKDQLYKQGALYASMSGSGSSVFGIFKEKPDSSCFSKHFVWNEILS